jgi:hypothetical protein
MKSLDLAYVEEAEEAEDCCYYYECSEGDTFNSRPLPFVIGSDEFINSGDAGLGGEEEEDEMEHGNVDFSVRDSNQSNAFEDDVDDFGDEGGGQDSIRGDRGFSVDDEDDDDDDGDEDEDDFSDEERYTERASESSYRPPGARPTSLYSASELSRDDTHDADDFSDEDDDEATTTGRESIGSVKDIRSQLASQMKSHNRQHRAASGASDFSDDMSAPTRSSRAHTDDSWGDESSKAER